MAAIAINLDRISIGIVFESILISLDCVLIGTVVKLIDISSDRVSMDVDNGFDGGFGGGFNGGFDGRFHLAVLGYQPQQRVPQPSQEAFTAINQEGVTARR